MKKQLLLSSIFVASAFLLNAQSITFADQSSTTTPTTNFHSGDGVGICDMNGDFKDDIIRAQNNAAMYIETQNAPNAMFT